MQDLLATRFGVRKHWTDRPKKNSVSFRFNPVSTKANEEPSGSIVMDDRLDKIFFAKQVINNACASQAIISILLNVDHEEVKLGSTLDDFKSFSSSFDPQLKG